MPRACDRGVSRPGRLGPGAQGESAESAEERAHTIELERGRLRAASGDCLAVPVRDETELVQMHVVPRDAEPPVPFVRFEQAIEAAGHLERLLGAARHDREVVRRVTSKRALPVDHMMEAVEGEQDVLPEEVSVHEARGVSGREMLVGPRSSIAQLGRNEPFEDRELIESVIPAALEPDGDVAHVRTRNAMNRRRDLGDDLPRSDRMLSARAQVERNPLDAVPNERRVLPVLHRTHTWISSPPISSSSRSSNAGSFGSGSRRRLRATGILCGTMSAMSRKGPGRRHGGRPLERRRATIA